MPLLLDRLPPKRTERLQDQFRAALLDDVIPWWVKHSPDYELGGYFSLLERDGQPYAFDKYIWTTGREIWMFSHLYNECERRPEWLELARNGADFLLSHAFRDDGKMNFRLTRDGRSMATVLSIYTECFGAIALAELSKAAGEPEAMDIFEVKRRFGKDLCLMGGDQHAAYAASRQHGGCRAGSSRLPAGYGGRRRLCDGSRQADSPRCAG